jgi:hypothetical protein
MLELPGWYIRLGRTPGQRQRKFRSLVDRYLVESGMKRNPKYSRGHFIGNTSWVREKRKMLRDELKKKPTGPPGESEQ